MIDISKNEFVPVLGADKDCVIYQLHNPHNAKLLKDFVQMCLRAGHMKDPLVTVVEREDV